MHQRGTHGPDNHVVWVRIGANEFAREAFGFLKAVVAGDAAALQTVQGVNGLPG